MSVALIEHLTEEENKVLPLVSVHITQAEWDALGRNGASSMPKGAKGFDVIGMILQETTPQERAGFLRLLPAPVRMLYRSSAPASTSAPSFADAKSPHEKGPRSDDGTRPLTQLATTGRSTDLPSAPSRRW
jgi:hypothetical protein